MYVLYLEASLVSYSVVVSILPCHTPRPKFENLLTLTTQIQMLHPASRLQLYSKLILNEVDCPKTVLKTG